MMRCCLLMILIFLSETTNARGREFLPAALAMQSFGLEGFVAKVNEHHFIYEGETPSAHTERTLVFDSSGRLKEILETDQITRYGYDNAGTLVSIATVKGNTLDSAALVYNRAGLLKRQLHFNEKKQLQQRIQYSYNDQQQLINVRYKNEKNMLQSMVRIHYRKDQREIIFYDEHLRFVSKELWMTEHDASGKRTEMCFTYHHPDTCDGMRSIVYDDDGKIGEETVADKERRVIENRSFTYNSKGFPEKQVLYKDEKQTLAYSYTWDEKGNWRVQQVTRNGILSEIYSRTIEYDVPQ